MHKLDILRELTELLVSSCTESAVDSELLAPLTLTFKLFKQVLRISLAPQNLLHTSKGITFLAIPSASIRLT